MSILDIHREGRIPNGYHLKLSNKHGGNCFLPREDELAVVERR